MTEDIEAEIEKMQSMSLSYRIYLLSRRDFLSGILIGLTSSILISYITQLDIIINNGQLSVTSIIYRLLLSASIFLYIVYNYRKRTKSYEVLLKRLSERIQKMSQEMEIKKDTYKP